MKKKLSLLMIALVAIAAFAVQVSRRAATEVANIAALNVLENGAEFNFTGEALVVYQNGNYVYVKDDTGSTLIYKKDVVAANSIGKTIAANWTGKVNIYKNLFEVVPDATELTLKEGDPVAVSYPVAAIADVKAENVNQVVTLKGVTYSALSGKNFTITSGETTVAGYNQFNLEIAAPEDGKIYDIVGAISRFNDNIQFQPIQIKQYYAVNVAADIPNGTVTVDKANAPEGDVVTITATPAEGYKLLAYSVKNGEEDVAVSGGKFTMPAGNVTVSATFAQPEDITIAPESGDIVAALKAATTDAGKIAKNITINLTKGVEYTLSSTIKGPANITINGNGATIDASTGDNIVGIEGVTELAKKADETASTYSLVNAITFKNVTIKGMKKALVRDLMSNKTLLETLTIDNCVIEASNAKVVIDFDGRGYVGKAIVKNSTIWAAVPTAKHFAKYGSRPKDINGNLNQEFDVQNSTFVNIAANADFGGGQNFNNFSQKGTANNIYTLKNNIFVNCGKSGQVVVGFNAGQTSATPVWNVDGNAFNWNGADVAAAEVSKAGTHKVGEGEAQVDEDIVKNSVEGLVAFKDAANGDFTLGFDCAQYAAKIGDPRWLVENIGEAIVLNPATGADLYTELTTAMAQNPNPASITINLAENGAYTISGSLSASKPIAINGNDATIDASALAVPFIQMAELPTFNLNEKGAYLVDAITIKDVKITGLKYQLIYGNKQKYLIGKLTVDDSVIAIDGTNKKTILDFNGGGNASEIIISNSTLWANPSNAQNGGLFSSQSGHGSIQDLGSETQLFAITNSTIYNIAYGKTTNSQRRNNTAGMEFKVENSVIANSGKSGQFVVGLNGGSANAAQTYTINNNIFNFDGADVSAAEQTKVQEKIADKELNSVAGVMAFTNAAEGDFGGTFQLAPDFTVPTVAVGDPRWQIMYKESPIKTLWKSTEAVALAWGTGVDVEKANTDIIQVGDVIHVAVEGVTAGSAWSAQVAISDQAWTQLENGVPVGTGDVADAAFVVTGDMLALIKANGLKITGDGYSTKQVTVERGVYMGSENSIWVGDATLTWTQASVTKFHFINTNVAAGQIIKLTYEATGNPNIQLRYGWGDTDVYGNPTYGEGFATLAVSAEAVEILKDKGLIINADGIRLTQMELLPAPPVDITINPESGADIYAALKAATDKVAKVGNITIVLAENGNYTVSAPLVAPANLTIFAPIVSGATIDASGNDGDFITLNGSDTYAKKADGTDSDHFLIDMINIWGLRITGLKGALVKDSQKTFVKNLGISESVIEVPATKNVLDFNGKGYIGKVAVFTSTIYAKDKNTGFFAQYGSRPKNIDGDWLQEFEVQYSTIVNIANGKNFCDLKQNGTAQNVYTLKNNIFVDCGKNGQVVVGFNKGQASATPVWDVDGNIFNAGGEDKSAAEVEKAGQKDGADIVKNSVAGVVTFTNAAEGDFNGTFAPAEGTAAPATMPGDPRWTIAASADKLYVISDLNGWDRTALTELTFNAETQAYEWEIAPTGFFNFAFATKQLTAAEAEADPNWEDFNNNYRYAIAAGDNLATLNEALPLLKVNGTIQLKAVKEGTTYKISVAKDLSTVTITGEFAPEPQPVTVDKLFIMGTGTPGEWSTTTELTFNEATQAFEYEATVTEDTYLTFGDAAFTSWDEFNGKHRYAPAEGNTDAVMDQATQLVLVNNGCVVLKNAGTYKISVTKDLKMTITAAGTGINSIAADKMKNATIYTVSGQRVEKAQKGLYIIDGRKVVIK